MGRTLQRHEPVPGTKEGAAWFLNPVVVAIVALIALLLISAVH